MPREYCSVYLLTVSAPIFVFLMVSLIFSYSTKKRVPESIGTEIISFGDLSHFRRTVFFIFVGVSLLFLHLCEWFDQESQRITPCAYFWDVTTSKGERRASERSNSEMVGMTRVHYAERWIEILIETLCIVECNSSTVRIFYTPMKFIFLEQCKL